MHRLPRAVDEVLIARLAALAARHEGLELLLLYGSRATNMGVAPQSDWDFGFLGDARLDPEALRSELVGALDDEDVDVVNLARASAQLRFHAARDGTVIFASHPEAFPAFWHDAVEFWCDVGPLLRRGYADILAELPRA